jgi:hypothetical protein
MLLLWISFHQDFRAFYESMMAFTGTMHEQRFAFFLGHLFLLLTSSRVVRSHANSAGPLPSPTRHMQLRNRSGGRATFVVAKL